MTRSARLAGSDPRYCTVAYWGGGAPPLLLRVFEIGVRGLGRELLIVAGKFPVNLADPRARRLFGQPVRRPGAAFVIFSGISVRHDAAQFKKKQCPSVPYAPTGATRRQRASYDPRNAVQST
jgi:hypothetical protein